MGRPLLYPILFASLLLLFASCDRGVRMPKKVYVEYKSDACEVDFDFKDAQSNYSTTLEPENQIRAFQDALSKNLKRNNIKENEAKEAQYKIDLRRLSISEILFTDTYIDTCDNQCIERTVEVSRLNYELEMALIDLQTNAEIEIIRTMVSEREQLPSCFCGETSGGTINVFSMAEEAAKEMRKAIAERIYTNEGF